MAAPDMARLFSALFDFDDASGLLLPATRQEMLTLPFQPCVDTGYGRGWFDESLFFIEGHIGGWLTDLDDGLDVHAHTGGGTGVQTIALWRERRHHLRDVLQQGPDLPGPRLSRDHHLAGSRPVGVGRGVQQSGGRGAHRGRGFPWSRTPTGSAPASGGPTSASSTARRLANSVRLRLYSGEEPLDRDLELAPGEFRSVVDVMSEFQATGSAPLRVFSSEPLTVTSRTYNQAPDGTFGQFIDSMAPTAALATGDQVVLMQLQENPAFRTNIGLHNGWKRAAEIEVALFDGDSLPVAYFIETVDPDDDGPAQPTVSDDRRPIRHHLRVRGGLGAFRTGGGRLRFRHRQSDR